MKALATVLGMFPHKPWLFLMFEVRYSRTKYKYTFTTIRKYQQLFTDVINSIYEYKTHATSTMCSILQKQWLSNHCSEAYGLTNYVNVACTFNYGAAKLSRKNSSYCNWICKQQSVCLFNHCRHAIHVCRGQSVASDLDIWAVLSSS